MYGEYQACLWTDTVLDSGVGAVVRTDPVRVPLRRAGCAPSTVLSHGFPPLTRSQLARPVSFACEVFMSPPCVYL